MIPKVLSEDRMVGIPFYGVAMRGFAIAGLDLHAL